MAVAAVELGKSRRQRAMERWSRLLTERSSWDSQWRDIGENFAPRKMRFEEGERNRGTQRNDKIVNLGAVRALRVATSGMVAGLASPADVWFSLTTPDPDLTDFWSVRGWLEATRDRMLSILAASNFYRTQQQAFKQLLTFATASISQADDPDKVVRFRVHPIGTYCLANDGNENVATMFRITSLTTENCRDLFPRDRMSSGLNRAIDEKRWDDWHTLLHVVEPRGSYAKGRMDSAGMPWSSCWYEKNAGSEVEGPLYEAGFEEKPILGLRWDTNGEDVYGTDSPGMDALGTVKELYHSEKKAAQGLDKLVSPPMVGPTSLMTGRPSTIPGDITYVDAPMGGSRMPFQPAYQIEAFWDKLELRQSRLMQQVLEAFSADIWLILSANTGGPGEKRTAEEVRAVQAEKVLQLGPVTTNTQNEYHGPMIARLFGQMLRAGHVPTPPQELHGKELKVEFQGYFSQAQKSLKVGAIERHTSYVMNLATVAPTALEKFDEHEAVEAHAQAVGVPPKLTRSEEATEALKQQRAAQQQMAAMAETAKGMAPMAGAAKDLSETDVSGDNALTRLTKRGAA